MCVCSVPASPNCACVCTVFAACLPPLHQVVCVHVFLLFLALRALAALLAAQAMRVPALTQGASTRHQCGPAFSWPVVSAWTTLACGVWTTLACGEWWVCGQPWPVVCSL